MTETTPLEDSAIRNFVARGCLDVRTDLPASYHAGIRAKFEEYLDRGEDLENHVLWRVPELHQVFDHPAVRSALTAILGPDYIVNPHTYCHLSRPGSKGHAWHKDSYIVDHNTRHARPRWLMALYTPHDMTEDLGPTAVIPRWQYHDSLDDLSDPAAPRTLTVEAGTITLLHADMWHGARGNRSDQDRFLVKFLFERRQEPWRPAHERQPVEWCADEDDLVPLLSMDVWRWLRGESPMPEVAPESLEGGDEVALLMRVIESPSETSRLRAAYALGRMGARAVESLVALLRRQAVEAGGVRGPSNPKGINPAALPAAQALSSMSEAAVPALVALAGDPEWQVQLVAADTLGNIGPWAVEAVPALARLAGDPAGWQVRRNAIEALGRIGSSDGPAGEAMIRGLSDSDVRVRLNAAMALGRALAPPVHAIPALKEARERDENIYVRYYAGAALEHVEPRSGAADRAPVRRAWSAMDPLGRS